MEQKVLIFSEDCIIKNSFYQRKERNSIDKVESKKIVLPKIYSYDNKVHLNILLDI